ncbi:sensor histidine kinase [Streptomyces aurantiogriseus]|uniref:Oxygen sensor histidine kinase NreB n=1 Tax=Streptomyces aurantiogriseus TaxID=66870 RepID=A0A918CN12_9ACTN|nr:sensor histidine kinase [Streptomyces aurantiogriseus]GGR33128.1 two-component sensor histidine kinase [Streptomyces aurantiogriseus]
MSDRAPARIRPTAARGSRSALPRVAHLTFFLVLGAGTVRLVRLRDPLCWDIVAVSGLLALVYAGGLLLWDRLGRVGRAVWAVALLLLWAGLLLLMPAPLVSAYGWCAVPLACAALRALNRRAAGAAVAAITAVLAGQLVRSTGQFDPEAVLVPVAAVWGTVALYRGQQRDAAERQRLVEELRGTRDVLARQQRQAGVLAERARIARDLHDTLAQELAGSVMLLQAAERDWDTRPDTARTRVRAVADGLHANLGETRRIIRDLTPSAVDEAGLEGAVRLLCARAQAEGAAARVRFRSAGALRPALDSQAAATLFRVAQGTLANVREHARAVDVLVTLHRHEDRVELEVRDDGVGFDPGRVGRVGAGAGRATADGDVPDPSRADAGRVRNGHVTSGGVRGLGLPTARARLRECGGDLDVSSAPGRGTRVRAVVPALPESRPAGSASAVAAR